MPISIVIPTLNSERDLERCLSSLKPQLSEGDEIILVDGGSEDNTLRLAYDYGCKLFLYPKSSIGQARHFGVEVAKNDVVLQTDSDVTFPVDYVERLKAYFEKSAVAVAGPSQDAKGRAMVNFGAAVRSSVALMGGPAGEENLAFLKEAYYQTCGFEDVNMCEGLKLWGELGRVGLRVFDPSLYVYHAVDSWHWTSLPSYLIGAGLLGTGLAYEEAVGGSIGYALIGAGAGFGLGQLGVDLGINKDAPPNHFHHYQLGLMIVAAVMSLGDLLSEDVQAGLYAFGGSLVAHDLLTESTV